LTRKGKKKKWPKKRLRRRTKKYKKKKPSFIIRGGRTWTSRGDSRDKKSREGLLRKRKGVKIERGDQKRRGRLITSDGRTTAAYEEARVSKKRWNGKEEEIQGITPQLEGIYRLSKKEGWRRSLHSAEGRGKKTRGLLRRTRCLGKEARGRGTL